MSTNRSGFQHMFLAAVLIAIVPCLSTNLAHQARGDEKAKAPNIVLILADDKN